MDYLFNGIPYRLWTWSIVYLPVGLTDVDVSSLISLMVSVDVKHHVYQT